MDKLQLTFKDKYVSTLKYEVENGINLDRYSAPEFEYDKTKTSQLSHVYQPDGLLEKMMKTDNDYDAAILLYEAYKNITPLLASTEQFWVYLTHVDLYPYVKRRWPATNTNTYILDHWFFQKGYLRNGLATLWWSVYCSVDENRKDPYELTRIFFHNFSFRTLWLKVILRTKEALLGTLEFLNDHPEILNENFENRGRTIAKYLNMLGGTKQLSNLKREYVRQQLENIKDTILNVTIRDDVQNKDISAMIIED